MEKHYLTESEIKTYNNKGMYKKCENRRENEENAVTNT